MKFYKYITSLIAFFFLISCANLGYTFNLFRWNGNDLGWNSNTITVEAENQSFPTTLWEVELRQVINNELNNNPSNFSLNLTFASNVSGGNRENETWFSSSLGPPAQARYWYLKGNNPRLVEADVIFDQRVNWTTSNVKTNNQNYGGSNRPWANTAMHEFGHFFGLAHEAQEYNILGEDWDHIHTNGGFSNAYFGEDASQAAVSLYGTDRSRGEDLGVTHWRWNGSSGGYSSHSRTRVFDTSGNRLSRITDNGEPFYLVDNGQTVEVEFTYENNGVNFHSGIEAGFYLSTDDTITTLDRQIGGSTFQLGRNDVYTTTTQISLPNDLNPNQKYWIGVVIDSNDNISEWKEANNATYVGIRTKNFMLPTPTNTPMPTPTDTPTPTPTPTSIIIPTIPIPTITPIIEPTPPIVDFPPIERVEFSGNLADLPLEPRLPFNVQGFELGEVLTSNELPLDNAFEGATDGQGLMVNVGPTQAVTLLGDQIEVEGTQPVLIRVNVRSTGSGSDVALAAFGANGSTTTNIPSDSGEFTESWQRMIMVAKIREGNPSPILQVASTSEEEVTVYFDNLEVFVLEEDRCIPASMLR